MYACMHVCMYVCQYIYIHIYILVKHHNWMSPIYWIMCSDYGRWIQLIHFKLSVVSHARMAILWHAVPCQSLNAPAGSMEELRGWHLLIATSMCRSWFSQISLLLCPTQGRDGRGVNTRILLHGEVQAGSEFLHKVKTYRIALARRLLAQIWSCLTPPLAWCLCYLFTCSRSLCVRPMCWHAWVLSSTNFLRKGILPRVTIRRRKMRARTLLRERRLAGAWEDLVCN